MYKYLSSYEVPVLLSLGFTFGIADTLLWGAAVDGQEYQVIDNGEWLLFGRRRPSGGVDSHVRMTHREFNKLFRK